MAGPNCWLCGQPCQQTTATKTPPFASQMWWEPGPGRTAHVLDATQEAA